MKELPIFDLGVSDEELLPSPDSPSPHPLGVPSAAERFPARAAPHGVLHALGQLHALPARWQRGSRSPLPCPGGWRWELV